MKEAAVLIPIFRDRAGELHIVLVRRSEGGVHGGQLAFPGGKSEPQDRSMLGTALRETEEEIGLASTQITILEHLPIAETRTTGFRIYPFLGRIIPPDKWRPEAREIAEVIEIKIDDFFTPTAHQEAILQFPTWPKPQSTPFYQIGPNRVWGVTYRILHPLLPQLVANEWV